MYFIVDCCFIATEHEVCEVAEVIYSFRRGERLGGNDLKVLLHCLIERAGAVVGVC
jgi:hypothetical protein